MILAPKLDRVKVWIAVILAALILCLAGYWLVESVQPVHAAGSKPEECELVAVTGAIVVYYCEPDDGPAFLVNNIGFMAIEQ
jgi:hypothetical protein